MVVVENMSIKTNQAKCTIRLQAPLKDIQLDMKSAGIWNDR